MQTKPWRRPVVARDPSEGHRQASWLELFFDLSFVVAVAQGVKELEHFVAAGEVHHGLVAFAMVFAAIWWAWMAFTWFANVFDSDDVPYRLLMMVMIAGSLGLAAGVHGIAQLDFRVGVLSYVVMRLAYVAQWLRVARSGEPEWRPLARRMALLTTVCQVGWVLFLWVPTEWKMAAFVVWFAVDIGTPLVAGWDARTGGHRGHIVERYGLFTIIVLGESIAAATVGVGHAIESSAATASLLVLAVGGLVVVFSIWWIYFDFGENEAPGLGRASQYVWGYGHFFLFAAVAALGAGLALAAEQLADPHHVAVPPRTVALFVAGPVALFLVGLAVIEALAERRREPFHLALKGIGAALALAAAAATPRLGLPTSVLLVGTVLALLVVYGVVLQHRRHPTSPSSGS